MPVDPRRLIRIIEPRLGEMVAATRELVEMESPSFSKAEVDRLGRVLQAKFEALGGAIRWHPGGRFGNHLEVDFKASLETRRRAKPIMLLGHFDTVYDLGTLRKTPFRATKDRLFGPGTLDMKCGIVMMMAAIRALAETGGLPRAVTVLLNTDEEVGSESSRPVTEKLARQAEAVFVLEPAQGAQGALKTSRKGVGDYHVKVTGRAAHSGVDFDKGRSAIVELARQIERIAGFTDIKRGLTVNAGVMRGGTRTNVVAAEAEADIDVRIAKMKDARLIEKKFRGLRAVDRGCKLEVRGGLNRPPMERTRDIAALFAKARQIAGELGWELKEAATGGGSDGNFTAALSVPTLDGMGAVGEGAHSEHESVLLAELPRRTALLAAMIAAV
ncbi:MAG TPA: M20 family metallopeptidase [Terriglobales bacterium]|nr:M20 family metallopeptidase [Terriglobales bacterium]